MIGPSKPHCSRFSFGTIHFAVSETQDLKNILIQFGKLDKDEISVIEKYIETYFSGKGLKLVDTPVIKSTHIGLNCKNYIVIDPNTIEPTMINNKNMKKITIKIAFGASMSDKAYDEPEWFKAAPVDGNEIVERSFNTMAEVEAYVQGMQDMNGWTDVSHIIL